VNDLRADNSTLDHLRVLILEDNDYDAEMVLRELLRADLAVEARRARDRSELLNGLETFAPDVILSDYSMPGFNGRAALEAVRRTHPTVPFIIVTGSLDEETAVSCIKAGATDYVLKDRLKRLGPAIASAVHAAAVQQARESAERALSLSERRFRTLLEHSSDLLIVVGDGNIVQFLGPSAYRILGRATTGLIGGSLLDFVHPDDAPLLRQDLERARQPKDTATSVAFRCSPRPDVWLWFEGNLSNLVQDPAVAGLVLNVRDVTKARLQSEQLRQAQKMEAIGRLAGGVAHDFNNLLTVISGYGEMLQDRLAKQGVGPRETEMGHQVQEICKAASRATVLTQQLLAYSRQQVLATTVVNLNAVIEPMMTMLRRMLREDIAFSVELDPELWPVQADANQLGQVLMNLAVNARDAMPSGGQFVIRTHNQVVSEALVRDSMVTHPGNYVVLEARDDGHGMDDAVQSRIFDPFFTTKPVGKGTGMGLAMVYGVVKQSGGSLYVESSPQAGSTFRIFLPRHDAAAVPTAANALQAELLRGSETILVVEDGEEVRNLMRDVLTQLGYRVLDAHHGQEALRLVEAVRELDLLLTDVVMPVMTGPELSRRLRQDFPHVRVLYTSASMDPGGEWNLDGATAGFLVKPFTPEALARSVRAALDGPPPVSWT